MSEDKVFLTVKEALEQASVSRATLSNWVSSGKISDIKSSDGRRKIRADEIEEITRGER